MTSRKIRSNPTVDLQLAEPDDGTPVSVSGNGDVVSYYGDACWDLTPLHSRHLSIRFVARNEDTAPAAQINCKIFKRIVFFWLHERIRPISATTICTRHAALKHLVAACDHHRVLLTEVSRYPALLREVSERIPASTFGTLINILRELGVASRRLGFSVADERTLSKLRALRSEYQSNQSPYIPERIYSHIIERCQQLVSDYLRNRDAFERLYRAEVARHLVPGESVRAPSHKKLLNKLALVMESWLGTAARSRGISYPHPRSLTKFLTAVRFAGHVLIIAFSGMRNLEALTLTTSCIQVDSDAVLGDVYMLQGRTTKTIRDDKAVWITSKQVLPAIEAMSSIAHLRARAARDSGRSAPRQSAILLSLRTTDPWIRSQRGDLTL